MTQKGFIPMFVQGPEWLVAGTREPEPPFEHEEGKQRWIVGNKDYAIALCIRRDDAERIASALNAADFGVRQP